MASLIPALSRDSSICVRCGRSCSASATKPSTPTWCAPSTASTRFRIDGVGKALAFAPHALLAGNLTFTGGLERSVANLDLTLSLVMPDDQAIWRDAGPRQLE